MVSLSPFKFVNFKFFKFQFDNLFPTPQKETLQFKKRTLKMSTLSPPLSKPGFKVEMPWKQPFLGTKFDVGHIGLSVKSYIFHRRVCQPLLFLSLCFEKNCCAWMLFKAWSFKVLRTTGSCLYRIRPWMHAVVFWFFLFFLWLTF